MTVESVQYINDLEPARPQGGDSIAQGDDHIRNIKKGIKNTFKNIDGEVNASQDELNTLVGIDTSKPLKDQLTDGAQGLQDQISDNTTSITDLSGRVSDLERDLPAVADMVTNQKIEDHADVDITTLEAGMALVWDGTNWVAQKVSGGGMITVVQQPATAGDFNLKGFDQTYGSGVPTGNAQTRKLIVPDGMVFCFEYLFGVGGTSGYIDVTLGDIYFDGVKIYPSPQAVVRYDSTGGPIWPGNDKSSIIRVKESIEIRSLKVVTAASNIYLAGFFAEA